MCLCPKTGNLASSLDAHLRGDKHKRKVEAQQENAKNPKPCTTGRVGRPCWQASVVTALDNQADGKKQSRIDSFLTSGSSSVGSSVAPKGIVNAALICWGLWQRHVNVDGLQADIKPFLLDQKRGTNWYCEPDIAAEIQFKERIIIIDGCFRHTDCLRFDFSMTGFSNFTCDACCCITQESDFRARVRREHDAVEKRGTRDTARGRRIDYLRSDEVRLEHRKTKQNSRTVERELWVLRARCVRAQGSKRSFVGVQTEMANRKDVTTFCRSIVQAWRDGLWGGREALWEFMKDVTKNLVRKKEGHRFSQCSSMMWEVVKMRAGPAISNFLTTNLHGPSFSSTQRQMRKGFKYVAGESAKQIAFIGRTYAKLKAKYGIEGPVPFILAEDETSIRKMIKWIGYDDTLQGFCGVVGADHKCFDKFVVHVGDKETGYNAIVDAFSGNVRAGYARVILANPLHESLPALLVVAMCTCNSFEAEDIRLQWTRVEKLWTENCLQLAGPVVGHASDGDSRRRSVMLHNYYRSSAEADRNFHVDWEGFDLKAQIDNLGNVNGLDDQDWIHNVKKLISPLDSSCRLLWLGPFVVRMEHIQKLFNTLKIDDHGLSLEDIHRKDRQNFRSAQCLCSREVVSSLVTMQTDPQYAPPEKTEGTEIYLEIVGDYVDIFASPTLNLQDKVVLASKVMWFLKLWRLFILHGEHGNDIPTLERNFISQQCFIDIVMSCHFVVLLLKMFRDKYPSLPVPLSRTGSDVCEIFFSKVGGMAGVERSYDFGDLLRAASILNKQAELEGDEAGVQFPRAHKKMKIVWEQLHPIPEGVPIADLGDYSTVATDSGVIDALKEGFTEAQKFLRVLNMAPSTNCNKDASRSFRVPWEFSEPLQKNLEHLAISVPEHGDNGEMNGAQPEDTVTGPEHAGSVVESGASVFAAGAGLMIGASQVGEAIQSVDVAPLPEAEESDMEGPVFEADLQVMEERDRAEVVCEAQHVIHEMHDEVEEGLVEHNVNEALQKKKYDPMVCLPGKDNEFIWKARLVSQLNGNPFLSKDRLQRVKGEGNQYYSPEELRRLRDDSSVPSLCCGHDIAMLFEGSRPTAGGASSAVVGRRGSRAASVQQQTSETAFIEIGRVQVIRRKNGRKWTLVKEILDMENPGSACVEIYCYWYTCTDLHRFSKFKYDGVDKCWVSLATVIQVVNLAFAPRQNLYTLDASDASNLIDYLKLHK